MDTTAIRLNAYRLLQSMEVVEADTRSDPTNDWLDIDAAAIRSKARRLLEAVDNREDTDRAMIEEEMIISAHLHRPYHSHSSNNIVHNSMMDSSYVLQVVVLVVN